MSAVGYVLWLLAPVCQIFLLIFMLRRKLRAEFPFFFSYTVFQVISFAVQYGVYHFARDHSSRSNARGQFARFRERACFPGIYDSGDFHAPSTDRSRTGKRAELRYCRPSG